MKEYALYNDDEFITIGTTKEIADELGVKEHLDWLIELEEL